MNEEFKACTKFKQSTYLKNWW